MNARIRQLGKYFAAGCAVLLVAGILAPYLGAGRYAAGVRSGLESALGRPVEFGAVHFNLFTGPGFSISKVVIHEDPAAGLEPFAYVELLEARLRLRALLGGRLEFASLRLEDTSVNLAKFEAPSGTSRWNFTPLLQPAVFTALPAIHVRSGRINFRFGDTKSVFYIINADLDLAPPSRDGADWQVAFSGEPARTDRPARGFGSLAAQGRWHQPSAGAGRLDLDFQLEKSAVNEMITLIYGRDMGVHGVVSARARLSGALADLKINGRLHIEDVHRWDLMPQRGEGWLLLFEGHLNIPAQRLELAGHPVAAEAPPLAVRFRVADYLSQPHWGIAVNWNRFRVEPLLQLARHLGASLPAGLKLDGTLDGAIGYAEQGGLQGQLAFQDAALTIPDSPPIRCEQARLLFDGARVHLAPAVVRSTANDLARIEAYYQWDTQAFDLTIATDSMDVAGLRSQAAVAAVPILEQVQSGVWKGRLRYHRQPESPGGWSGAFQLTGAEIPLAGVAEPLKVRSAQARLDGARVLLDRLEASVGEIAAQGEYRYEPKAPRPHRFRLSIPSLQAAELERLLLPTLRRNRGLIARALGFGRASVPDWLRDRHMEGSVQVGALRVAEVRLEQIRARVLWMGSRIEAADVSGHWASGVIDARLSVDLRLNDPAYRLSSRLKSVEWNGGKLDADLAMDTRGIGAELLANLRSDGSFTGQSFELEPLDRFKSIAGCYVLEWAERAPRLRLTDLRLSAGEEVFLGDGSMQEDGRLVVQVSSGVRQLSLTGTLSELRLEEGAGQ